MSSDRLQCTGRGKKTHFEVSCCLLLQGLAKPKDRELGSLSIHIAFPSLLEPVLGSSSIEEGSFFYERPFHPL
jgi:hypothetical protein